VRFVLDMDISGMTASGEAGREVARILRYWAGAVQRMDLKPDDGSVLHDSAYRPVGRWTITSDESERPV